MRRTVWVIAAGAALGGIACGAIIDWRRNPRLGTMFVNTVVNPRLLRRGLAGGGTSEIGTIEHFGRRSGVRRLTPVHPEVAPDGIRVLVPLGPHSEWARNVLAAGHCRLQLHDLVYELDEPRMIPANEVEDLPWVVRRVMGALGFEYLKLRTFGVKPGALEPAEANLLVSDEPGPGEAATEDLDAELVASTH